MHSCVTGQGSPCAPAKERPTHLGSVRALLQEEKPTWRGHLIAGNVSLKGKGVHITLKGQILAGSKWIHTHRQGSTQLSGWVWYLVNVWWWNRGRKEKSKKPLRSAHGEVKFWVNSQWKSVHLGSVDLHPKETTCRDVGTICSGEENIHWGKDKE